MAGTRVVSASTVSRKTITECRNREGRNKSQRGPWVGSDRRSGWLPLLRGVGQGYPLEWPQCSQPGWSGSQGFLVPAPGRQRVVDFQGLSLRSATCVCVIWGKFLNPSGPQFLLPSVEVGKGANPHRLFEGQRWGWAWVIQLAHSRELTCKVVLFLALGPRIVTSV